MPGACFITICTADRRSRFGSIRHGEMRHSRLGELAAQAWQALPERYGSRLQLDEWVVMPNHLHGILLIHPGGHDPAAPAPPPVGQIVGGYKSGVTREWNLLAGTPGAALWQPRFYDHVIRHEHALQRIREYIRNNPRQWTVDRENPQRSAENEFYRWLEAYCRKTAILARQ